MAEIRDFVDADAPRIVNDVCTAILKAAGEAIGPYEKRANARAYLVAAFSMAADQITNGPDPMFGKVLAEMLQKHRADEASPEPPPGPRI
jgi:hypothetical protein